MTFLFVQTPGRELVVAWSHPWRKLGLRGMKGVQVKVSQCMIGNVVDKAAHKFLFGGLYQVKWPIYSEFAEQFPAGRRNQDGTKVEDFRAYSRTTLPHERLSKDRGRRLSLKEALKHLTDKSRPNGPFLSKGDAAMIWEAYFERWPIQGGSTPTTPPVLPTPRVQAVDAEIIRPRILLPASSLAVEQTAQSSPEGHGIVSKVVRFPPRIGFFPAYSNMVH